MGYTQSNHSTPRMRGESGGAGGSENEDGWRLLENHTGDEGDDSDAGAEVGALGAEDETGGEAERVDDWAAVETDGAEGAEGAGAAEEEGEAVEAVDGGEGGGEGLGRGGVEVLGCCASRRCSCSRVRWALPSVWRRASAWPPLGSRRSPARTSPAFSAASAAFVASPSVVTQPLSTGRRLPAFSSSGRSAVPSEEAKRTQPRRAKDTTTGRGHGETTTGKGGGHEEIQTGDAWKRWGGEERSDDDGRKEAEEAAAAQCRRQRHSCCEAEEEEEGLPERGRGNARKERRTGLRLDLIRSIERGGRAERR